MNAQKNQEYLLKVFEKAALRREDAILMMVGSGPDYEKLRDQIECHPYRDRIILYGETENPSDIYSSFDVFVFPSRYEDFLLCCWKRRFRVCLVLCLIE